MLISRACLLACSGRKLWPTRAPPVISWEMRCRAGSIISNFPFAIHKRWGAGGKVPYITQGSSANYFGIPQMNQTKHTKGILSVLLMDNIPKKKNTPGILKAFLRSLMSSKCLLSTEHCTNCHVNSWHLPYHCQDGCRPHFIYGDTEDGEFK